jgi:hypothetical protein
MMVSRWWIVARTALPGLLLLAGCSRTNRAGAVPNTYAEAVAEVEGLTGAKGHPGQSSMGSRSTVSFSSRRGRAAGSSSSCAISTFRAPVEDLAQLARRVHAFCPDFVEQGIGLNGTG